MITKQRLGQVCLDALERAARLSNRSGLPFVSSGHLLAALAPEGYASIRLYSSGLTEERLLQELNKLFPAPDKLDVSCSAQGRYSPTIYKAIEAAQKIVRQHDLDYADSGDLLQGLLLTSTEHSSAQILLSRLGTDVGALRDSLQRRPTRKVIPNELEEDSFSTEDVGPNPYEVYMHSAYPAHIIQYETGPAMDVQKLQELKEKLVAAFTGPTSAMQPVVLPTVSTPPVQSVLDEASYYLLRLARELPQLRRLAAEQKPADVFATSEDRQEFLKAVGASSKLEADRLQQLAQSLRGLFVLKAASLTEKTKEAAAAPTDTSPSVAAQDECPQNHHLKDGPCDYAYCHCPCTRCTAQCEARGR